MINEAKPDTTTEEASTALANVEMTDLGVPGDANLVASYSQKEVEDAKKLAAEVIELSKQVGKTIYDLAIKCVEMEEGRSYEKLGFETFAQWYGYEHYSARTIRPYMQAYKVLRNHDISLETYRSMDITKAPGIIKLGNAGATKEQLVEALDTANDLLIEDWITFSDQAVDNIKAGEQVGTPTTARRKSAVNTDLSLAPGYYVITKVESKDIGKASPETNHNLVKIRGLKAACFGDPTEEEAFHLEVK